MATDKHRRTIAKGVTWRFTATATTFIISWVVTGNVETALAIGGIEFVVKFLVYYMHERAWQLVPWGLREPAPEPAAD
jgi:uncharacterized membrane protein